MYISVPEIFVWFSENIEMVFNHGSDLHHILAIKNVMSAIVYFKAVFIKDTYAHKISK